MIHIVDLAIYVIVPINALKVVAMILIALQINLIAAKKQVSVKNVGALYIALTVSHVQTMYVFGMAVTKMIPYVLLVITVLITIVL
jgi:hypothetical protein